MGYRMKYTGEEVESRLEKVEANEESIAAIDGRVSVNTESIAEINGKIAENEGKISEVESKADANESKIAEVDEATKTNAEDIASLGGKVAEVESAIEEVGGKADANATAIAEVGGKVTEIEGSITEINGSIDTLLEGVAAVDSKADSNNERINTIEGSKLPYVTQFSMAQILNAAVNGVALRYSGTEFYIAVESDRVFVVKTNGGGTCVAHTYIKNSVATAILYDADHRKWYTLSAAQSDRYITVTASDTVNLMDNEIYTTDFTMQQIISALEESEGATLSVSTEGFVAALAARKSIFIPDDTGGGYISLSSSYTDRAVFYVAGNSMFLTIIANGDTLQLRRRFFSSMGYADREVAYKLSGNDGQGGGNVGEVMGQYKIQYRSTVCPTFVISGLPSLRVGEVLNLRFIFTAGLGAVTFANNDKYQVVRDRASDTKGDTAPAIVDVTVINPAEGAKTVVFYTVKKYS